MQLCFVFFEVMDIVCRLVLLNLNFIKKLLLTEFYLASGRSGGARPPVEKNGGRVPPASSPHYTPGCERGCKPAKLCSNSNSGVRQKSATGGRTAVHSPHRHVMRIYVLHHRYNARTHRSCKKHRAPQRQAHRRRVAACFDPQSETPTRKEPTRTNKLLL